MIRLASSPIPHHENLAHAAARMLGSEQIMRTLTGCQTEFPAASVAPGPHSDINIPDWNDLFHAVEARLIQCVSSTNTANSATGSSKALRGVLGDAAAGGVGGTVLECVAALNQLHAALTSERERRSGLDHGAA